MGPRSRQGQSLPISLFACSHLLVHRAKQWGPTGIVVKRHPSVSEDKQKSQFRITKVKKAKGSWAQRRKNPRDVSAKEMRVCTRTYEGRVQARNPRDLHQNPWRQSASQKSKTSRAEKAKTLKGLKRKLKDRVTVFLRKRRPWQTFRLFCFVLYCFRDRVSLCITNWLFWNWLCRRG